MRYLLAFFALLSLSFPIISVGKPLSDQQIEDKVDQILGNMSLDEKIGQMNLADWGIYEKEKDKKKVRQAIREGKIGGFLNVNFAKDKDEAYTRLQKIAVEESPNKIPLIFGQDVIHGYKTIFPIPLGQASSWDKELIKKGARVAAQEASTDGIRWTFAPMIDISRDPRWGRIAESLGEDPYLTSELALAMMQGFQTDDLTRPDALAACAKHFVGYGAAEGGRDYNTTFIPEAQLRDLYLPPFKTLVDNGLVSIMSGYQALNGVPATAYELTLKQILRDEWGFDGFVVSDWNSVEEMIAHGYAKDSKHAAELAANAGIDFEMHSHRFDEYLKDLIKEGKYTEAQLNTSVRNMLRAKLRMGLMDNPYPRGGQEETILNDEFLEAARDTARKSFVLLKNDDNVLPLDKEKTVAVIGPLTDAPYDQLGTWIYDADKKDTRTFLPAIRSYLGDSKVIYAPGLKYSRDKNTELFDEALAAAKKADVILYVGGEEQILSGEGHSLGDISFPGAQEELIAKLSELGKPLINVIMAGRPLALRDTLAQSNAILMAWHPGTMGGPALVDVLYGESSPKGRLPLTWPIDVGQIPIYYNHYATGRPPTDENYTRIDDIGLEVFQHKPGNSSNLLDYGHEPQFPFGFGLSYTEFKYSKLKLSKNKIDLGGSFDVSVKVKNIGKVASTETVQLYVRDHFGSVVRPVKELKGFKQVTLDPGKSETVKFTVKSEDLSFHNQAMEKVTEPGDFTVFVGGNSRDVLSKPFVIE